MTCEGVPLAEIRNSRGLTALEVASASSQTSPLMMRVLRRQSSRGSTPRRLAQALENPTFGHNSLVDPDLLLLALVKVGASFAVHLVLMVMVPCPCGCARLCAGAGEATGPVGGSPRADGHGTTPLWQCIHCCKSWSRVQARVAAQHVLTVMRWCYVPEAVHATLPSPGDVQASDLEDPLSRVWFSCGRSWGFASASMCGGVLYCG